jgi:Ca-activated chloride channel family protein
VCLTRTTVVAAVAPVITALALSASPSGPQAQEPVFRTGTRTVPVYVTVTDAEGRLVPDLGRDDFEIYDNGRLQTVSIFANDIQPIMVVMMLDRSGSMVDNFRRVQEAAEQFVTRLLPADKARIGSFSYRVQVDPRTFTNDRDELLRILYKELQEPGPTPLWNAVSVGMTGLLRQEGRRVVLVFTDGADRPGNDRATNISLGDLMKRAREEDVMVYGVGLAGRMPMGGMGRRGGYGGGRYPPPPGGWSSAGRTQKPDEGLSKLAAESGGGYFELESTDDLGATFARVADELHRQYAMGFSPEKLDGKTHKLEVRVKKPGMTARARKSYVATPPRTG